MEVIPATLQYFPKSEEQEMSEWSDISQSCGESLLADSDVEDSHKDEQKDITEQ